MVVVFFLNYIYSECHGQLFDPMDCSLPGSSVRGIFQQEYWSGLPFPSPGDLPNPGIEPRSPALQVDSLPSEPPGKTKTYASVCVFVHQLCRVSTTLCDPMDCSLPGSLVHGISQQEYWNGLPFPSPLFKCKVLLL